MNAPYSSVYWSPPLQPLDPLFLSTVSLQSGAFGVASMGLHAPIPHPPKCLPRGCWDAISGWVSEGLEIVDTLAVVLAVKHQWLKHAAACCSTCFWGLLVGVLKHAAACCSTLKIGLGFNPIPEHSFIRDGQYSSGQMLHL